MRLTVTTFLSLDGVMQAPGGPGEDDSGGFEPGGWVVREVSAEVPELTGQSGRELQVHGSGRLAQSLLDQGLVDEYRLLIYPVVRGHGKRLFTDGSAPTALDLIDSRTTSGGVVVNTFLPRGKPQYGFFGVEYS